MAETLAAVIPGRRGAYDWKTIDTAPKTGEIVWLSDGFFMRLGFWRVVTVDPSREQWADLTAAEAGYTIISPHFDPKYWQTLPAPPERH